MKSNYLYFYYYFTLILGMSSQILFGIFMFTGPLKIFNFGFSDKTAMIFDAALSFLFFLQHSVIVRKSVKEKLSGRISENFYGAFYSNTSALALFISIALWQPVSFTFYSIEGITNILLMILFLICIMGFYWAVRSLGSFDPFGIKKIKRLIYNKETKSGDITIKGPYRWVRHPLYFFMIIMIWSFPHLTADRLLFNILWTAWIIIGTFFEERDLAENFGEHYMKYRKEVPMLVPYKIPAGKKLSS